MIFLFKSKSLNIDCFTDRAEVYECALVDYSKKFVPDWWKNLPKEPANSESLNMRYCSGFNDLYRHGLMIPLWSDLNVTVGASSQESGAFQYSDRLSDAHYHPESQRFGFAPSAESMHLKLINPWYFKCEDDTPWLSIGAQYNQKSLNDYMVAHGVLNFKYQYGANINLFFCKHAEEKVVYLPHGTPLMQLVPVSERKLKIHRHLVDQSEMQKLNRRMTNITFQAKYYKHLEITKNNKCLF